MRSGLAALMTGGAIIGGMTPGTKFLLRLRDLAMAGEPIRRVQHDTVTTAAELIARRMADLTIFRPGGGDRAVNLQPAFEMGIGPAVLMAGNTE